MDLFRKKALSTVQATGMKRDLKTKDLIMLGIGAIIGTGIFVVTGVAASQSAGPALAVSFVLAAIVVILSALCFAEFSSRIPVLGGPYAYLYVVFGEIVAWIAGWMLLWEFMLAVSSVASGWSGYAQGFLASIGIQVPKVLSGAFSPQNGTYFDLIAVLVLIFVTAVVSMETKRAFRLNNAMVYVKFGIIILFIIVGIFFIKPTNWKPFMPFGFSGVVDGAALVFFAFLGFDSIAMAAGEVKNPQRDIPRGIIGSILIATVLYIVVTLILTGMVPADQLNVKDPVAFAMRFVGHGMIGTIISVGAILTLLTVTISMMYSLARLLYAISKDGLLPQPLTKIDPKNKTPKVATYVAGLLGMFFAGIFPLNILAELTNIVALTYLILMAVGIIQLRKIAGPPKAGEFKVPLVPVVPILSVITCLILMFQLQPITWMVFGIVVVLGILMYFGYGYKHSMLNQSNK